MNENKIKGRSTMLKQLGIFFYVILISVFNISCGEDGGDEDDPAITPETGIFLDAPVGGINYQTLTQSGVTDAQGNYLYLPGETVTFSIGDIVFPSAIAAPVVTPLDMIGATDITDVSVINIIRLLQSLDVDGDPTNGIEISPTAHTEAMGLAITFDSLTFDADVANLVANSGSVITALIDGNIAIDNFKQSLSTQTIDWESYYNFANNRQWNYIVTQGDPLSGSLYEYTINGTANGEDVYIHGWNLAWSDHLDFYLQDISNGLLFTGFQDGGVDSFFVSPIILACNNLYESCTVSGSIGGMSYSFSFINELDTVTVPAGSFNDCIKTTQTDNIGSQNRVMWHCKDTGQVKHEKVGDFIYELVSITVYNP